MNLIVYVYNRKCSQGSNKNITYIKNELIRIYHKIIVINYLSFESLDLSSISYLIFSGGDGTFNRIINKCCDYNMIFGYIPLGTANDIGKNLNIKNIKTAISTLSLNYVCNMPLMKVNDVYFIYALSIGKMASVSTKTNKIEKSIFRKYIYCLKGIKYLFHPKSIVLINIENKIIITKVLAVLILKTHYLGGIKISYNHSSNIYIIKNVVDLIKLFVFKAKSSCSFEKAKFSSSSLWCLDGEKYDFINGYVCNSRKTIKVIVPPNHNFNKPM